MNSPISEARIGTAGKNDRLTRLKSRRKLWLKVHLWLGLTLGFLLSVYGITGSILVFYAEIDECLNPKMFVVDKPVDGGYRPLVDIFDAGKQAMPKHAKHTFATYPRNDTAAVKLRFTVEDEKGVIERWLVGVDPYTAMVTGKRLNGRSDEWLPNGFVNLMFELHYALLIPSHDVSAAVVGLSGVLLIISTLTGLVVWWPLTGKWWQALTFKTKSSKVRFNYDLHKTSGFYTTLVMVPVLFSGVYMVLPHNVAAVMEIFSPVTYRYWFKSTPTSADRTFMTMDQAIDIARQQYPGGRLQVIYGAPLPTQTYTVCLTGIHSPTSLLDRRCVVMDRYSGKILDLDDPSLESATAGEIFTHWQWPLHSGQAFGMTGRILVFLTGLACPLLFVTGVIRWWQKRRAENHLKRKSRIGQVTR